MANLSRTLHISLYQNQSSIVEVMIKNFGVFFYASQCTCQVTKAVGKSFGPTAKSVKYVARYNQLVSSNIAAVAHVVDGLLQCEWFFSSWDEDVNVPVDEAPPEPVPISGMSEQLLAKAESLGKPPEFSVGSPTSF